jgi:hypothetical protein
MITVRRMSTARMPGMKTSADAARSSAIGKVTIKGSVAIVKDTSSLETIALTRSKIQTA